MDAIVEEVLVPAGEGRGVYVKKGQLLDIVDVEGHQVGDIVAWFRGDPSEYMSPTHTVSSNASIALKTGSVVVSNRRNAVFTIVRDDVEKHDIVVPCCDHERYFNDYGLEDHGHCLGNLEQARDLLGEDYELHGEMAWNVFMHNRVEPDGTVVTDPAAHESGATITLEAHEDLVVLLSACPQDLTACNNFDPTSMMLRARNPE
jgi:uncharacterized protein YcgI (DUF1989 family)